MDLYLDHILPKTNSRDCDESAGKSKGSASNKPEIADLGPLQVGHKVQVESKMTNYAGSRVSEISASKNNVGIVNSKLGSLKENFTEN